MANVDNNYEPVLHIYSGLVIGLERNSEISDVVTHAFVNLELWNHTESRDFHMDYDLLKSAGVTKSGDLFYLIVTSKDGEINRRVVPLSERYIEYMCKNMTRKVTSDF